MFCWNISGVGCLTGTKLWKTELGWKTTGCGWEGWEGVRAAAACGLSAPELRGASCTSTGRAVGRILMVEGVARLSDPKKEKAGARVSGILTVGLAVVGGGGGGAVVSCTGASVVVGAGAGAGAGLVTALFGRNLFSRRNAGKLLNPSLLSSSFSCSTSLSSSASWRFSLGRRLNLLGPFLLNNFLRGLEVVVVGVEVVLVLVKARVVTVGTNGDVAGAVTSSNICGVSVSETTMDWTGSDVVTTVSSSCPVTAGRPVVTVVSATVVSLSSPLTRNLGLKVVLTSGLITSTAAWVFRLS